MKKYIRVFISSILAGFCIVIGVCVFLSQITEHKIIGSLFFGLGLFTIIHWDLSLYTGKVGSILDNKPKFIGELFVCLIGNFIGVIILGSIIKLTRNADGLALEALNLVRNKQNDSWYSIFILSCMCGVMIYVAVKGHQKCPYAIGKVLFCFMAVSIFILCGFEHCVANAAYYTLAGFFDLKSLGYFCLMILGNAVGAVLIDLLLKSIQFFNSKKEIEG